VLIVYASMTWKLRPLMSTTQHQELQYYSTEDRYKVLHYTTLMYCIHDSTHLEVRLLIFTTQC